MPILYSEANSSSPVLFVVYSKLIQPFLKKTLIRSVGVVIEVEDGDLVFEISSC